MKYLALMIAVIFIAIGSASGTRAQVVDKTKDTAEKAAKVTPDAAKKTADAAKKTTVVVTDSVGDAADKTAAAAVSGAKAATTKAQTFGNTSVSVTENIVGQTYEGGKYYTVTSWDGSKWVSKQVWYPNKKSPDKP